MSDAVRPDPALDYLGALRWIMDHIEAIERDRDEERVGMTEAARRLGYKQHYAYGKAWMVPFYGLKGSRHTLRVWRQWWEQPESDLRAGWDALGVKDQARARGIAV